MKKFLLYNLSTLNEDLEIANNVIVVSGVNGIGKSYFFKNSQLSLFHLVDMGFQQIKHLSLKQIKEISYHHKDNMAWSDSGIVVDSIFNFKIIDLNKQINLTISNNFKKLLTKFKKAFSKYGNTNLQNDLKESNSNSNSKNKNNKLINIIKSINKFLNNKEITGLTNDLNDISFVDNNTTKKTQEALTSNILSDGEKKIFALAAIFLENDPILDDKNVFYIWDEPENSLHPEWQSKILHFLQNSLTKDKEYILLISHSTHIVTQAYIDKNIKLIKFDRKNDIIKLNDVDLIKDQKIRDYLNLNLKMIKTLISIFDKKTLIVEGKIDKKYLELILDKEKINIKAINGKEHSITLSKIQQYSEHISDLNLFLFDNDEENYEEEINKENYLFTNDKFHFLTDLRSGDDIEKYFQDIILKITSPFQFEGQNYYIIHKNNIQDFELKIDEKINNNIMKDNIKKYGFVPSDKYTYDSMKIIKKNNNEKIWIPSKTQMADYLIKNHKDEMLKIEGFQNLKKSIESYFDKKRNN